MSKFRFFVSLCNVHTGADSYGPETRKSIDLETKFAKFTELGFDAVQFHYDDAVPDMNNMTDEDSCEHLGNSIAVFKALEEKVGRYDYEYANKLIAERKFEQLEMYTMNLMYNRSSATTIHAGAFQGNNALK